MDAMVAARAEALTARLAAASGVSRRAVGLVRVPLRLCLLGAHVDHQRGRCLGLAIAPELLLAYTPSEEARLRLASADFEGRVDLPLDPLGPAPDDLPAWGAYAHGALTVLAASRPLRRGLIGLVGGSLPVGGLSSSAAVGLAYLLALARVNGLRLPPEELVDLSQRLENDCLGLRNGRLDPTMILRAERDGLTLLDCAADAVAHVPNRAGSPYDLAVVYSGQSRSLPATGYNDRVAECGQAAALLAGPQATTLGAVGAAPSERDLAALPPALARRARHFFGEQQRTAEGAQAWAAGDLEHFGALMRASGQSSIDNYECGSPALTTLHRLLNAAPGVLGARFCGAGFGGSAVALARPGSRTAILAALWREFPAAHPELADRWRLYFVRSTDSAEVLS